MKRSLSLSKGTFFGFSGKMIRNIYAESRTLIEGGNSMKVSIKILLIALLAAALLFGNYYLMTEVLFGPTAQVRNALKTDTKVQVEFRENQTWLVMTPLNQPIKGGLILYPEGYQDIRMYAPISRRLAENGYTVVLLSRREKFPPSAEQEVERAAAVRSALPAVKTWFIGAHTWGADIAAYIASHQVDQIAGVVLWAGRMSPDISLAQSKLPMLMVYGSSDDEHTAFVSEIKSSLPPQTKWEVITGGNRVNFANFGPMPADIAASIDMTQQQEQAAVVTSEFMDSVVKAK
jgi:dienelactone hydrolase